MGTGLSLSKSWTAAWLAESEWALLVFGIVLLVGLRGEYRDAKPSFEATQLKEVFKFMVMLGVVGEILADGGVFFFSSRLQTISDGEVAQLNVVAKNARLLAAKIGTTNAQLWASNGMLSLQVEKFRSNNLVLRRELEETEMPMDFWARDQVVWFGTNPPFNVTLRQIAPKSIVLANVADINAAYTANKLAETFRCSGWDFPERREIAKSCIGIYIGVNGWIESLFPDINNWPKHPENPCVQSASLLLKLLTDNGLPARIGPPRFDISVPTNTILIVIGQRPSPIMTKWMILQGQRQVLDAEEREIENHIPDGFVGTYTYSPTDQTNLMRIYEKRVQLSEQESTLYNEQRQRDLRRQNPSN